MTIQEAIESSKRALATSESEWHAYPYTREVPPHHLRWRLSIEEMQRYADQGKTLEEWLRR